MNMQCNHHRVVKNTAQFSFSKKKREKEGGNPKNTVSKAVSETTFPRKSKIRVSFLCSSVKKAIS